MSWILLVWSVISLVMTVVSILAEDKMAAQRGQIVWNRRAMQGDRQRVHSGDQGATRQFKLAASRASGDA